MSAIASAAWPRERLGEMFEALARRAGLPPLAPREAALPAPNGNRDPDQWMTALGRHMGFEVEPIAMTHADAGAVLAACETAVVPLPSTDGARFVAVVGGDERRVRLLEPDGKVRTHRLETLHSGLCDAIEHPVFREVEELLLAAGISGRGARALVRERLASTSIGTCWRLRLPSGFDFVRQIRQAGLVRTFVGAVLAHATQYVIWVVSWWLIGRAALEGSVDRDWAIAWLLMLITLVPVRSMATWLQARFAVGTGARLKQRLLDGAMRLEPEELRSAGAGQLIGRMIESEAVESLALTGGMLTVIAAVELAVAVFVLSTGAGGAFHAGLLVAWALVSLVSVRRFARRRRAWVARRVRLTHDLIERMVGHRTRLVQQLPEQWHADEDEMLEQYLDQSNDMDGHAAWLVGLVPRGWMVIGLLGLMPAFVAGEANAAALAIAVGGVLMAFRAFERMSWGLWHLCDAVIAWREVAPLFHAAARPEIVGSPQFVSRDPETESADGRAILEACDLVFRHSHRAEPTLRGCNLRMRRGDRILLQGPSGAGKSTLAALLVGLREPASGIVLLHGLDRHTLGSDGWRKRVTAAPQFHENHVFAETFAFNLLLSRRWPPRPEDIVEAERICRELGLGPLLERMPGGLMQMVGDTGWQLSHGERSRLFIARALLQGAEIIVLDESFAALDPESLETTMRCVLSRAPSLIVVAHP